MPTTGPSKADPTGLRRQIARERAAADAMARAQDRRAKREAGNANDGFTLRDCPGYAPDIEAMGDCARCGWTREAHDRKERS